MTDFNKLALQVHHLMMDRNFQRAEKLLLEAREKAKSEGDIQLLNYIFTELIGLCQISEPPLWEKAEAISSERERLIPSAHNILQTAMVIYYGSGDYKRAVLKLNKAIAHGKEEDDDKTTYAALSLLGQAYLEMGQNQEAVDILSHLEKMVAGKKSFVAGDETSFLENLKARKLEIERINKLASVLAPVCRDPSFRERLAVLIMRE